MTCNKCGNELADGTNICPKCGATQGAAAEATPAEKPDRSPKYWCVTALLCFLLGCFGIHRFYTRRYVSGVVQLLAFLLAKFEPAFMPLLGIWVLCDLVAILRGKFKDRDGLPVKRETPSNVKPKPIEPNLALFAALRRDKAIFCQECGAKIEVGVSSCPKCGWKTLDDDNVKNSEQYKEALELAKEVDRLKPEFNSLKKGGLLFIGLVMAIALSVIGYKHGSSWVLPVFFVLWGAIVFVCVKSQQSYAAARRLFEEGIDIDQVKTAAKTAIKWGNMWHWGIVLSIAIAAIVGIFVIISVYGVWMVVCVYIALSFAFWLFTTVL